MRSLPGPLARRTILALLPLALLLSAALFACADDPAESPAPGSPPPSGSTTGNDLVAAASEAGLTAFTALADTAGLTGTLRGEGPYTVFAPTNEAFGALPQATRDSLTLGANRARLARLLRYHVVPGRIESNMFPMGVRTLEGGELALESGEAGYLVRDAQGNAVNVVTPDVNVSNGVVHVIDRVLMPPADGETVDGGTVDGETVDDEP